MKANVWRSLIAVLAGNAIYLGIYGFLPPKAQHQPYRIDWGLAIDAWICVACWGLLQLVKRRGSGQ
jgi:hypothetical protein